MTTLTSTRGLRYEFAQDDTFIPRIVAATGKWEDDVAGIIEAELQPGWTLLDIGASVGYFTCLAASRGNPVIAVEPAAVAFGLLQSNLIVNGLEAETRCCALADYEGVGHISVDADEFPGNLGALHLTDDGEAVLVRRLSDVVGSRRPEMIKIDIEGMEGRVLRDAPEIVSAARVVIFEASVGQMARYGDSVEALVGYLQGLGFVVTHSSGAPFTAAVMQLLTDAPYGYMNLVARHD